VRSRRYDMSRPALAVAIVVIGATAASAQTEGPVLKTGARVLLTIPLTSFREDTHFSGWSPSMKTTSLDALVETAGAGAVAVNGDADWRHAGFPSLLEMEV
jgi:hypothetical protein